MGSSPLTRGKLGYRPTPGAEERLIPAHAGKTVPCVAATCHLRAHPRSRGENVGEAGEALVGRGSSPLTRGKRFRERAPGRQVGLIPAHAGKTTPANAIRIRRWAHPRSRGENAAEETAVDIHLGSSPLTRGKRGHG